MRGEQAVLIEIVFQTNDTPPEGMRERYRITEAELAVQDREPGVELIPWTEKNDVSLVPMRVFGVEDYVLQDVSYRIVDTRPGKNGIKTIYQWYFVFVYRDYPWEAHFKLLKEDQKRSRVLFDNLCQEALWKVRVFKNAFYDNGEKIEGAFEFSVNCNSRQPLFHSDGKRVMRWQPLLMEDGEQYEDYEIKRPLAAANFLVINGDTVSLISAK